MNERSALVLIEFQKEWMSESGKLNRLMSDREQFGDAVKAGRRALDVARRTGTTVVHCGLRFQPGHPELANGRFGLREAIPRFGTFPIDGAGSEFGDGFEPAPGEFVVYGRTGGSGFSNSNLDGFLRNQNIEHIYLAGFALHVCVESTLRVGHDLGYHCSLLAEATAAFTGDQRTHVLDHVVHHFGENSLIDDFAERCEHRRQP